MAKLDFNNYTTYNCLKPKGRDQVLPNSNLMGLHRSYMYKMII